MAILARLSTFFISMLNRRLLFGCCLISLSLCIKSCRNHEKGSLKPFFDSLPKVETDDQIWDYVTYSRISKEHRIKIYSSICDTTKPISEALDLLHSIKSPIFLHRKSNFAALIDVLWNGPYYSRDTLIAPPIPDSLIELQKELGSQKLIDKLDSIYDQKVIYEIHILKSPFSPRAVFLDNNEVHEVSIFLGGGLEVKEWCLKNDTIVYKYSDSLELKLIEDSVYLRPTKHKRFYFKHLRAPKSHLIKNAPTLQEQGH